MTPYFKATQAINDPFKIALLNVITCIRACSTVLYKVYKLEGPQRQRVESCRILSRPGTVKHLK